MDQRVVSWLRTLGQVRGQMQMTHQGQGSPKGPSLLGPHVLPQHHQDLQTPLPLLTSELQTQPLASGPSACQPKPHLCHSGA